MENNDAKYRVWMVRSGRGGYLIDDFLKEEIIAIGWNEVGTLENVGSYDELKRRFINAYPEDSIGRMNQCVGQLWRFLREFQLGDKVVTYDSAGRNYFLGEIVSEYKFSETYGYHHYRKVAWYNATDRDELTTETKNILGAISTIFILPYEVWDELSSKQAPEVEAKVLNDDEYKKQLDSLRTNEEQDLQEIKEDIQSRSIEFIKDIISRLSWQDTERLVGGLLKTLGYKTRMTSKGGDLGSDIIASPDELGLEEPRIKVEVKKRSKDKISAPDIRNFIGGMRGHHKGIYVTTTGFSKEAIYEAERANFAITLVDSNWLVELLISNYESLDPEIKALVPLRKIYWPV